MGEALKALNWPRDTYAVSSKVFWGGGKPTQDGPVGASTSPTRRTRR